MAPSSHPWMRAASRSNGTTGAKNAGYASRATSSYKVMNVPAAPVASSKPGVANAWSQAAANSAVGGLSMLSTPLISDAEYPILVPSST